MMREYTVLYENGDQNWSAYVPDLPGCIATGATRAETEHRIQAAIHFHIEGMGLHGDAIPEPSLETGIVAVRNQDGTESRA